MARDRSAFQGYPEILTYFDELDCLTKEFESELRAFQGSNLEDAQIHAFNCLIRFHLALGRVNERAGFEPTEAEVRSQIIRFWKTNRPQRVVTLGEERALATRAAYVDRFRINEAGTNDTPIEAAMLMASRMEVMKCHIPAHAYGAKGAERDKLIKDLASEIALFDLGGSAVSVDAIRKSISRFRKSIKGTKLCWFNEETCQIECAPAEAILLDGLPNKRGRPRKNRPSN